MGSLQEPLNLSGKQWKELENMPAKGRARHEVHPDTHNIEVCPPLMV